MMEIDYSIKMKALAGQNGYCGDSGLFRQWRDGCFIAHMDALGHGREAARVVERAAEFLSAHFEEDLIDLMNDLHEHMKGTRGLVAALCRFRRGKISLEYVGIGNIGTRIFGKTFHTLVPAEGIVGFSRISPKRQEVEFYPGDFLILTSDGVREHFALENFPGLLNGNAERVSDNFIEKLAKEEDDASCSVMRYFL